MNRKVRLLLGSVSKFNTARKFFYVVVTILTHVGLNRSDKLQGLKLFLSTYNGSYHHYSLQYFHFEIGKFMFFGLELPTPKEWNHLREISIQELGRDWLTEKFTVAGQGYSSCIQLGKPRATILVSLYKSINFLDYFLGNLLQQNNLNEVEIMFLSVKPSTAEKYLLLQFQEKVKNCQIIEFKKKVSVYQAWNEGIIRGAAPLITNMNVDDCRFPNSISHQIKFMEADISCDVVYQDFYVTPFPNMSEQALKIANIRTNLPEFCGDKLVQGLNLPHHAPMWRRRLHDQIGFFNESLKSASDYDFWLRAEKSGAKFRKDEILHTGYFLNPTGVSSKLSSRGIKESKISRKKLR